MLNQFFPKSITEWTYLILIVVLLITLIFFYKGIMKCKSIIEGYNEEIRIYKRNSQFSNGFVLFVNDHYSYVIDEYVEQSDITKQAFDFYINEVINKNA